MELVAEAKDRLDLALATEKHTLPEEPASAVVASAVASAEASVVLVEASVVLVEASAASEAASAEASVEPFAAASEAATAEVVEPLLALIQSEN